MDKHRAMSYPLGLTMDPTKGGLSLQGPGLANSHCLAQFSYDPGFAERAPKFSSFASSTSYAQLSQPIFPPTETGKLCEISENDGNHLSTISNFSTRVGNIIGEDKKLAVDGIDIGCDRWAQTDMKLKCDPHDHKKREALGSRPGQMGVEALEGATRGARALANESSDEGEVQENSSCSEQADSRQGSAVAPAKRRGSSSPAEANGKRASSSLGLDSPNQADGKGMERVETKVKRLKAGVGTREAESDQSGDSSPRCMKASSKPAEPPKQDFIHVRARRGQATDSHSLAERVRREKISERMKFLQDLVPGCSKVTGKAVMLDEIINYVQSLQRQIEFLSMKLAAVNPRLDFNLDSLLNKEMMQSRSPETTLMGPDPMPGYQDHQGHQQMPQQSLSSCSLDFRTVGNVCDTYLRRSMSLPVPTPLSSVDDFNDPLSQTAALCDGDLQSIVEMGFPTQGRQAPFSQGMHGSGFLLAGHMKVEI